MRSLLCEPDGIILTIGETQTGFNSVPVKPVANESPMGTRIIACYARHSHLLPIYPLPDSHHLLNANQPLENFARVNFLAHWYTYK